jgi:hypothetical protein
MSRHRTQLPIPSERPLEPVYVVPACRCCKYPFTHVHATEPQQTIRRMPGDKLFALLKELAAARKTN